MEKSFSPIFADYQYLWDGSHPEWCLLETKARDEDERMFIAYNDELPGSNPTIYWQHKDAVLNKMLKSGVRIIDLSEKLEDPVREYCRLEGFSEEIIRRTFDYLIEHWEVFVEKVVSGTYSGRSDYLYDLMFRNDLERLIDLFNEREIRLRMSALDEKLKTVLLPSTIGSIWAAEFTNETYSKEKHWYYFMLPSYTAKEWEKQVQDIRGAKKIEDAKRLK